MHARTCSVAKLPILLRRRADTPAFVAEDLSIKGLERPLNTLRLTSALSRDLDVARRRRLRLHRRPCTSTFRSRSRNVRREIAEREVEVDVNDRVNLYVAVKLKVRVDVEVLVEVHDPVTTARGALFYTS